MKKIDVIRIARVCIYGFLYVLYRRIPLWKLIYSCKNGIHPDKKHRLKTNINISKTRKNRKRMI